MADIIQHYFLFKNRLGIIEVLTRLYRHKENVKLLTRRIATKKDYRLALPIKDKLYIYRNL